MNSGLSCLSNTRHLTNYFIEDKFKKELNPDNPLARDGCALTKKYNLLLKNLWMGTSRSIAPFKFKRALGNWNNMFKDYA